MSKMMFRNVMALYPRINQPYRFDQSEYRTVPCDHGDQGAEYKLQFEISADQLAELKKACAEAYEELKKLDKKAPKEPKNWPFKEMGDGQIVATAKNGAMRKGEKVDPPAQYGRNNELLEDGFELTHNSKINVQVGVGAYNVGAISGVKLYIDAVQVITLAERQVNSPFEALDGAVEPAVKKGPFDELQGDDIPF